MSDSRGFFSVFNRNVLDMNKISNNTPNVKPPELIPSGFYYNREPGFNDGPLPTREDIHQNIVDPFSVDSFVFGENCAQKQTDQRSFSYLDIYTWRGGVSDEAWPLGCYRSELEDQNVNPEQEKAEELEAKRLFQIDQELYKLNLCGNAAVIHEGQTTHKNYYHKMRCKKHFCPICGGKKGVIHKTRIQAVNKRVDLTKYNLRQFVFTVPEECREVFRSRAGLNRLLSAGKRLVQKAFGKDSAAIGYIHLFGDPRPEDPGHELKFNPHVNIHIVENGQKALKLDPLFLDRIKKAWLRSLVHMGCSGIDSVDVHYSFRIKERHKRHSLKYMSRPTWGSEHIQDAALQYLLVVELKGFQYIRFWGALANSNYKETEFQTTAEEKVEFESVVGEKLRKIGFDSCVNFRKMIQDGMIKEIVKDKLYVLEGARRAPVERPGETL